MRIWLGNAAMNPELISEWFHHLRESVECEAVSLLKRVIEEVGISYGS
jgi:hypothetical protein